MMRLSIVLLFTLWTSVVMALPDGAPNTDKICQTMVPGHPDSSPQTRPPPFDILVNQDSFKGGDTLKGNTFASSFY